MYCFIFIIFSSHFGSTRRLLATYVPESNKTSVHKSLGLRAGVCMCAWSLCVDVCASGNRRPSLSRIKKQFNILSFFSLSLIPSVYSSCLLFSANYVSNPWTLTKRIYLGTKLSPKHPYPNDNFVPPTRRKILRHIFDFESSTRDNRES